MSNISAYTREFDYSNYKDKMNYILINCSGYYRNQSGNSMLCNRKMGRSDYLLMYCAEGNESVIYEGEEKKLSKGFVSLHRPGDPQCLHYNQVNSTLYWVHFTGFGCDELLMSSGLTESKVYFVGKSSEIENIFLRLTNELLLKRKDYEKICSTLLTYCFLLIGRSMDEKNKSVEDKSRQNIYDAISYINSNYSKKITIENLANYSKMSKYEFIRKFKAISGYPPVEYLINVRIEKAKEIIERSDFSVKATALEVGYDNPFYFSRLFKKRQGMSPEQYIRQMKSW